MPQFAYAA